MDAEHADEQRLNELSGKVIGAAFNVLNTLGARCLEKVHGNALVIELRKRRFARISITSGATIISKQQVFGYARG